MENNFEKMQKIMSVTTKWDHLSKLAHSLNQIKKSASKIIEMHDKLTPTIPTFDFPKFAFDIPSFDKLFNNELLEKLKQIGNI